MSEQMAMFGEGVQSPFEAIKNTRMDGTEFWSARDLMPLLGYEEWRKFSGSIARAGEAARNQGMHLGDHFGGAAKVIPGGRWGEQSISDFHLSRFAAYLVAMNGDPRKPEIAAAQAYFAIRTREAELAQPSPAPAPELTGAELMARALVEANRTLEAREAQLEAARPKVEFYDGYMDADGNYSMQAAAKVLKVGPNILFRKLRQAGVLIAKGSNRNLPYQRYMHHFEIKVSRYVDSEGDAHVKQTTMIRPSALPFLDRKLAELGGVRPQPDAYRGDQL